MIARSVIPVARRISTLYKVKPWQGTLTCVRPMASIPKDWQCDEFYRIATMDDLPVPCGDWCEAYANKQRKYNLLLVGGLGFFIITAIVSYKSGLLWCNAIWPDEPAPRRPAVC